MKTGRDRDPVFLNPIPVTHLCNSPLSPPDLGTGWRNHPPKEEATHRVLQEARQQPMTTFHNSKLPVYNCARSASSPIPVQLNNYSDYSRYKNPTIKSKVKIKGDYHHQYHPNQERINCLRQGSPAQFTSTGWIQK